jgi:CBS domain containing-hemolysin-like protein
MTSLVVVLVVLVLVIINGVYVASEFALVGVSRALVDADAESGDRKARRVQAILDDPRQQDRYIAATQLGVTFASLGLGMYGEKNLAGLLMEWFAPLGEAAWISAHLVASIAAVGIMTVMHVVIGEMVPKSIALANPRIAVQWTVSIALVTKTLLLPLVLLLEWMGNRIMRLFGIDRSDGGEDQHTPEDLMEIVRASQQGGELTSESGKALGEMFDFASLKAEEVMVPRVSIHGLTLGASTEEIRQVVKEGQHTRYPVHEEDLDEVIGMVHIRDLLQCLRSSESLQRSMVRPITFVPETMAVDRVLGVMRREKTHAVIVMDEQGGTAGLLTVKDLFEEVVGKIEEGSVEVEGRVEAFRDEDGRLHVLGTLRMDELTEVLEEEFEASIFGLEAGWEAMGASQVLPATDAETVSGLVLLQLGRPARVGDTVVHGGVRLVVIEVEGRGVKQCLVEATAGS